MAWQMYRPSPVPAISEAVKNFEKILENNLGSTPLPESFTLTIISL
jgi:hypothetical protein